MRDPAALAARLPRAPDCSTTSWALFLLQQLYVPGGGKNEIGRLWRQVAALDPAALDLLKTRGIGARIENYGADFQRFESDLETRELQGPARFPVVSVPSTVETDWRTGALTIRSRTFILADVQGELVFLSREPRAGEPVKITLGQMRLLHRTWRRWPAVLPSMLLTVLWHWPLHDEPLPRSPSPFPQDARRIGTNPGKLVVS